MWKYVQSTGEMFRPDGSFLDDGYSGAFPDHVNKPEYQCEKNKGPIPRGIYKMGKSYDETPGKGPCIIPLAPGEGNDLCSNTRDGFLIHGDKVNDPGKASTGCIILGLIARNEIANSNDKKLNVVRTSVLSTRRPKLRDISYTVLLKSNNNDKNAIDINTRNKTWSLYGSGGILNSKRGIYDLIGTSEERLLILKISVTNRIGDLRGFDPYTTIEGATGSGISDETGIAFSWTADKSIEV